MKKIITWSTIVIIFLILFWTIYNNYYSIIDNEEKLEKSIVDFLNRGSKNKKVDITIRDSIEIKNNKIILFTIDNNLIGEVTLKKGINGKFKIEWAGHGTNMYRYRVRELDNDKYLTVMGVNYNMEISYIKIKTDNKEYTLDIPKKDYFISYCKVEDIEVVFPQMVRLYNSDDEDITDKYRR